MRPFAYARPATLSEASALLDEHGPMAAVLAGGTDLVVALRSGAIAPQVVVDVKRVAELAPGVTMDGVRLRIGATTVMADVERDQRVRAAFPALADAAATVGSVQIRNRATVVGNICHASPAADTVPALLIYGAELNISSARGARRLPLSEFLVGPGRTALERGELVTSIDLPVGPPGHAEAFGKVTRRRGVDLATVNLACMVDARGRTQFACGAVGPRAFLVADESGVLADPSAEEAARQQVLGDLLNHASPISDVRASREYREAMLHVMSLRLLRICLSRLAST
ncbi:MAG: xanthine dehydrogenase family protein subunit M [Candidatus Dormibacteria bacterium]|jgi:carbon-monoxide dehydrogenase medium subunit